MTIIPSFIVPIRRRIPHYYIVCADRDGEAEQTTELAPIGRPTESFSFSLGTYRKGIQETGGGGWVDNTTPL